MENDKELKTRKSISNQEDINNPTNDEKNRAEVVEVRPGDFNVLTMTRPALRTDAHAFGGKEMFGVFLDGGKEGEILMPKKYVPKDLKEGDQVRCFVYLDQDERLVATTEEPLARVGEFAYLKCNWVNEYGAFLDWGLMKNLFCPFGEQKMRMEIGSYYIVFVYIDQESYRIAASAKIEKFIDDTVADAGSNSDKSQKYSKTKTTDSLEEGEAVDLLVWQKTDLGFKVIINNRYAGLIYSNQIFQYIHTGDRLKGYIQYIRPDGKIDVSLQPIGRQQTLDFADTLLQWLKDNGGKCDLGDKSDAEEIKRRFQVSKKVFKKAVGALYKKRLIILTDDGIELL